jgi:hypothetical protein
MDDRLVCGGFGNHDWNVNMFTQFSSSRRRSHWFGRFGRGVDLGGGSVLILDAVVGNLFAIHVANFDDV